MVRIYAYNFISLKIVRLPLDVELLTIELKPSGVRPFQSEIQRELVDSLRCYHTNFVTSTENSVLFLLLCKFASCDSAILIANARLDNLPVICLVTILLQQDAKLYHEESITSLECYFQIYFSKPLYK